MVKVEVGNLLKFYDDTTFVKEIKYTETIPSSYNNQAENFIVMKVIFQSNPNGFSVYNVAIDIEGEVVASEKIFGDSKYGMINELEIL